MRADRWLFVPENSQSTKQASERLGQQLAEARSYADSLQGLAGVSQLPQFDSLIRVTRSTWRSWIRVDGPPCGKPVLFHQVTTRANRL